MAEINKEVLERLVSCKASTISASCDSSEFLIALAADLIDPTNKKFSVPNAAALPNLYGAPLGKGTMIYVESLGIHLIAMGEQWCTLDGRVYRNDGPSRTVWVWGSGTSLGDNTVVAKSSPVSVVGGFTDWCQVSAGLTHTLGVRINGTAWSWGSGAVGRLGDNTTVSKSSPVSVVGGFTDWCQVSAGSHHSAGLRENGTAWLWGCNNTGQVGDGTITTRSSPVSVVGGFTDWCQISVRNNNTSAIRNNGTIWTWGRNDVGQLGDNTIVNKSSPVSVVGGFTDWVYTETGGNATFGLRSNGTLWAWGYNYCGLLGNNNTANTSSPVSVVGGFTDWCGVSISQAHTLAIRTNGTLWTWGLNGDGQLGTNTTVASSSPVSVVGGFTDWCQSSAGNFHNLAVRTNGTAWAWGWNYNGILGDNTTVAKSSPVSVVGGFTDWCQVSAGNSNSSAIRVA